MRTFIVFLFVLFVLGGTRLGRPFFNRPVLLVALCLVISGAFYSYRVLR